MDTTRKTILALGLVILVAEYTFVICDRIHWTKYHYNGNTGHKHTPNEKVVQTEVQEPVTCCKLCYTEGSCNSFSYQPDNRKCTGCNTLHCGAEPTDSSVDSAETMFFSTTEESNGPAPAVRLTGGKHMTEGRLEVEYNGQWGTVCNDSFGREEAMIVCNMLNFTTAIAKTIKGNIGSPLDTPKTLPILLGDVSCSGSEKNLLECSHRAWGEDSCSGGEDVGITCAPNMHIRLIEGSLPKSGRVEVSLDGVHWSTLCRSEGNLSLSIYDMEAKVLCGMLGYKNGGDVIIGKPGSLPILMYVGEFSCAGSEESILLCTDNMPDVEKCTHNEDISVTCL